MNSKLIKMISLIMVFVLMGFQISFSSALTEIEGDSKISGVTVYPESAMLERIACFNLEEGSYKVIFNNIISGVDENSLRISLTGEASTRLYGAQVKKDYLEEFPSERINQLKEEIQVLEDRIKEIQNLKSLLSEKKEFLNSITLFAKNQIPQDLITKLPETNELKSILDFLDIELTSYYSRNLKFDIESRELKNKVSLLKNELSLISGTHQKLKRTIEVDLEVLQSGTMSLHLFYLVNGAAWHPIYDARANFTQSKIELISYGIISQITGEKWNDVNCTLSTAKPSIGGRMPYISPWTLKPYEPPVMTDRVTEAPASAYQKRAFREEELSGKMEQEEEILAITKQKGIAVTYQLPYNITVKSDKSENKFPISTQNLAAEFEYSSYPRVSPFAYLGSRVVNGKEFQLLSGRVNIFLEGDFVGTSSIDNIAPGEEFDLYLGVDENVKIERKVVEKKTDETLIAGIPSRTRKTTFKYKITVENFKSKTIHMKLFEAVPVSEDDRIKVKIEEVSPEPNIKDWDDRKGIYLWEIILDSNQEKEILYTFTIEHPRDMLVEGL